MSSSSTFKIQFWKMTVPFDRHFANFEVSYKDMHESHSGINIIKSKKVFFKNCFIIRLDSIWVLTSKHFLQRKIFVENKVK